jgi:hypothetical protein
MRVWMVAALLCAIGVGAQGQDGVGSAGQDAGKATAVTPAAPAGGVIRGTVKAGAVPLPGVAVTATNTLTGKKYATTTDVTGVFAMAIPRNGRYVVKAELAAFASVTQEALINAAGQNGGKPEPVVEIGMQLASRVEQQQQQQQQSGATATALAGALSRGVQSLSLTGNNGESADASAGAGNAGAQLPTLSGLGGGDAPATESVAVSGQMGQTNGLANFNEDDIRQKIQDAMQQAQRQGGASADMANVVVGMLGGLMGPGGGGGFGLGFGPGGGPGGAGGPGGGNSVFVMQGGGGGGGRGGGGFRGFDPTQVHGAFAYTGANGLLNANSYSVTGRQLPKPDSSRNTFIGSIAGSPYIPGLTKPNPKQFVFLSAQETRNTSPSITELVVPTPAQRLGDLTAAGTVYDPATGLPYGAVNCSPALLAVNASPRACIPQNELTAPGQALLNYYPLPNVTPTGTAYNYQTNTTAMSHSSQISERYNRSFGQMPVRGGGAFFGPGGFGGGGQGGRNAPAGLRQSITESFAYSHQASSSQSFSPLLGGKSETTGLNVSTGYTIGYKRFTNNLSLTWNRSHSTASNYFTDTATNPAQAAGVNVANPTIYTNPFYFGVPSVNLTGGIAALSDTTPSDKINQTISFSDFVAYRFKKHNLRVGVDFRRIHTDAIGGTNVLGAFTFSGFSTQSPAQQRCVLNQNPQNPRCTFAPAGSSIADLLLGLPQQTMVTAGLNKIYLRANAMDWYVQDDFRVKSNVTLNFGLRWEYFSPYVEKYNRLTNLNHNTDFTQISAVCATTAAGCTVGSPRSLVNPDRTMYAPRIGIAWQPKFTFTKQTVVRAGYGINYNTGQYASFAQKLAFQQPFAVTQTNTLSSGGISTGCTTANMTLANGFNCSMQTTQSNYAVNPNYRLGMVQVYNLDIQRTLPQGIVLNIGYTGATSGNLDIVRAPNRTATGVLNPASGQFNYEDSLGYQRSNALAINARKRLQKGVSLQATYTYSHSIDNASTVGGVGNSIAQDDQNLAAEESNSSFDVRHKVTGSWIFELPFGPNRAFLNKGGVWAKILDGYSVSGDYTFATGTYATPVYSGTTTEIAAGAGSSLRPNLVPGQSINGARTLKSWFNKGAFAAPAVGTYGSASRNSIELPGTVLVNGSLSKTIPLGDTRSFEARITANNAFNTVQYSGVGTTINSPYFGQVTSAAAMRSLTFFARYRF